MLIGILQSVASRLLFLRGKCWRGCRVPLLERRLYFEGTPPSQTRHRRGQPASVLVIEQNRKTRSRPTVHRGAGREGAVVAKNLPGVGWGRFQLGTLPGTKLMYPLSGRFSMGMALLEFLLGDEPLPPYSRNIYNTARNSLVGGLFMSSGV